MSNNYLAWCVNNRHVHTWSKHVNHITDDPPHHQWVDRPRHHLSTSRARSFPQLPNTVANQFPTLRIETNPIIPPAGSFTVSLHASPNSQDGVPCAPTTSTLACINQRSSSCTNFVNLSQLFRPLLAPHCSQLNAPNCVCNHALCHQKARWETSEQCPPEAWFLLSRLHDPHSRPRFNSQTSPPRHSRHECVSPSPLLFANLDQRSA